MVRITGIEPAPSCPDQNLNLARLPVPPYPHIFFMPTYVSKNNYIISNDECQVFVKPQGFIFCKYELTKSLGGIIIIWSLLRAQKYYFRVQRSWQRACFGSRMPQVQVLSLGPVDSLDTHFACRGSSFFIVSASRLRLVTNTISIFGLHKRKKPTETVGFLSCVGIALSSRGVTTKVFSALMSLTSVFGMGTGVPSSPKTPTLQPLLAATLLYAKTTRLFVSLMTNW